MKCSGMPFTGGTTFSTFIAAISIASWKKQCACTSTVLMRLP